MIKTSARVSKALAVLSDGLWHSPNEFWPCGDRHSLFTNLDIHGLAVSDGADYYCIPTKKTPDRAPDELRPIYEKSCSRCGNIFFTPKRKRKLCPRCKQKRNVDQVAQKSAENILIMKNIESPCKTKNSVLY